MSTLPNHRDASPFDPTLEVDRAAPLTPSAPPRPDGRCVELVEGSGCRMTAETQTLLIRRLRAATLVLFVGSGAFLTWATLFPPAYRQASTLTTAFHAALVLVLGGVTYLLFGRCPHRLKNLRLVELVVFGLTSCLFAVMQFETLRYYAVKMPDNMNLALALHSSTLYWCTLVFTYGIFIPNTVRRAAVVAGLMCAAPLVVTFLAWFSFPAVQAMAGAGIFGQTVIMMAIVFFATVYGISTMGELRREAFEARQLGQYRLGEQIGAGGMGEVYLAEHRLLKRPCAIKLIRPHRAGDPKVLARFEREVQATARLSHWNTIEIFDYGHTADGTFYYVMEYLPGLSLGDLVKQHGPLPPERAIHLLAQTCDALSEAHAQGLVHRDIKPSNIFAAQRGGVHDVVKLLDFGLVKPLGETDSTQLTQDGVITGTPLFMSPEQALDRDADARSDIYALGAVAYYLLTGRPPFDGLKPLQVLLAHAQEPVTPPSQVNADVPADLELIVLRALAKKPADRFADASSMRRALDECEAAGRWNHERANAWWGGQATLQPAPAYA
ncbi:MAG: serine/threonine protein kinase [Pirellulales bacterium]|nr:serine/threonine protein kinase [Pirellulales bacterium]